MRIAILQDDVSHAESLSRVLRLAGHEPHAFEHSGSLLSALEHERFDAFVLGWNIPGMSGVEVLDCVRRGLRSSTPVLFTGRDREYDVVTALRRGADDYMTEPTRSVELVARLEALSRRSCHGGEPPEALEIGPFRIDCQARTVQRCGENLRLTAKDFELAVLFLRNIGRLLSRGHIRKSVWGPKAVETSRTLDTYVSRVRNRLGLTPEHGWLLEPVYGYGYRLKDLTGGSFPAAAAPADRKAA